jgi:hypothetical protein
VSTRIVFALQIVFVVDKLEEAGLVAYVMYSGWC